MSRRKFLTITVGFVAGFGAALASIPFFRSMKPTKHLEPPHIDIGIQKLAPGEMTVGVWRKKPVFVVRRTKTQIEALYEDNPVLRDPLSKESVQPDYATNAHRSREPEIFVALGLCTHLGCSPSHRPIAGSPDLGGQSWHGGFFCPCHGAKYDLAGRVFQGGPAPKNLEIPDYEIIEGTTIRLPNRDL